MNRLFDYTQEVRFQSSASEGETIRRLAAKVVGINVLGVTLKGSVGPVLTGKVNKEEIVLRRVEPLMGTIFNPVFYGSLKSNDKFVQLNGVFTMRPLAKAILVGVFVILLATELTLVPVGLDSSLTTGTRMLPIFVIGLMCLLFLFVGVSKWLSRKDVRWISDEIREALK